jgi:DGQHR domain-containing protein
MSKTDNVLRVPALEVRQKNRTLYLFAVEGKRLHEFVAVSRIARAEEGQVLGYQRPEVAAHVAAIRAYLETDHAMLPNALVVAFTPEVKFEKGKLVIPLAPDDGNKPGFLVDGQQRAAAVRDAAVESFPVCVVGFVAQTEAEQREQFILVNSAKPLPKSLIYELLPEAGDALPPNLAKRKVSALLASRLNADADSPLRGLVKMPTNPAGVIQDGTVMRLVEQGLADGALADFVDRQTGATDVEACLALLKAFWGAVAKAFPDAWGLPPRTSRLSHAAGVLPLGLVMDATCARHRERGLPTTEVFLEELTRLAPNCHWTEGTWNFGQGRKREWDEVQNNVRDVTMVGDHLLGLYKKVVWKRPA